MNDSKNDAIKLHHDVYVLEYPVVGLYNCLLSINLDVNQILLLECMANYFLRSLYILRCITHKTAYEIMPLFTLGTTRDFFYSKCYYCNPNNYSVSKNH